MLQKNADVSLPQSHRARVDALFLRLNHREIRLVVRAVRHSEPKPLLLLVNGINRLCNGWIYIPIALYMIAFREWKLLAALMAGIVVCHILYACTKPRLARVRPCNFDETIPMRSRYLDEYSFPSGHCMTLSVVGILICWQHHAAIAAVTASLLLLCWARVASGQHYPSDIVAGIGIGYLVAIFAGLCLL